MNFYFFYLENHIKENKCNKKIKKKHVSAIHIAFVKIKANREGIQKDWEEQSMRVKDDDDSSWSMFWQPETNYANHGLRFFSHANPKTLHLYTSIAVLSHRAYTWFNNVYCPKHVCVFTLLLLRPCWKCCFLSNYILIPEKYITQNALHV